MKRVHIIGRLLVVLLAALLLVLSGSCGKKKAKTVMGGSRPATKMGQGILNGRSVPPLEDLLAELDTLQKPTSVDPQLWSSMKAELHDRLVSALGGGKKASIYQPPPPANCVKARCLRWEATSTDTTTDWGKLTWRYVNDGDYNEDGIVSIADVTPLAIHDGETYDQGDDNCYLAVLGLHVDEVRVALRAKSQIDHMRVNRPKKTQN
mgnify:CR=1 FL=1